MEEARKNWLCRNQMFLNGQAFVLAEKLESGKPCPVCGALEHPHPALSGDGHVTEKDVKDAEFLVKKAEAASKEDQQKAEEYRMKKIAHLLLGRFSIVAVSIILQFLWLVMVMYQFSYQSHMQILRSGQSQLLVVLVM